MYVPIPDSRMACMKTVKVLKALKSKFKLHAEAKHGRAPQPLPAASGSDCCRIAGGLETFATT